MGANRIKKQKPLMVDGNPYLYWVRELDYDKDGAVPLRVVVRADFGARSFCTITGLTNRARWHDYPDTCEGTPVALTPHVVCNLIRHAHAEGWTPNVLRTNIELCIDNSFLVEFGRDVKRNSDA